MTQERGHWKSRLGFVLAAAGSAVGLGNIWKFPYITGVNGGGLFVLVYLVCIALVGLPIMIAEIFIGRAAQLSPVGAFRKLSAPRSPWMGVGWLGVVTAFVILSYYSVVAGWALHYTWLSVTDTFSGMTPEEIGAIFGDVYQHEELNVLWHVIFMTVTVSIVAAGVRGGIEFWARILMPTLFVILVALMMYSFTTDGFSQGFSFVFEARRDRLHASGVLEALGHSFFTLSLGMGALITYGSYLTRNEDIVTMSATITVLDTVVALMACLVMFPIVFSVGLEPSAGPGLVFVSLPIAFAQIPGGMVLAPAFFLLLTFAALTSAISLLEVATSYYIDERGWTRAKASLVTGGFITILGIPCALSGGSVMFGHEFTLLTGNIFGEGEGKNWFDFFDYLASNWMLPLGGLFIALFTAWRVGDAAREEGFKAGSRFGRLYWGWIRLLRYVVPVGVAAVFLYLVGFWEWVGLIVPEEAGP